jgi:hypothetical protein
MREPMLTLDIAAKGLDDLPMSAIGTKQPIPNVRSMSAVEAGPDIRWAAPKGSVGGRISFNGGIRN